MWLYSGWPRRYRNPDFHSFKDKASFTWAQLETPNYCQHNFSSASLTYCGWIALLIVSINKSISSHLLNMHPVAGTLVWVLLACHSVHCGAFGNAPQSPRKSILWQKELQPLPFSHGTPSCCLLTLSNASIRLSKALDCKYESN